jgi:aspartate/methionine/tyrosine aminotransferase
VEFKGVVMTLFADREHLIDTENAFKIGPYIKEVEQAGTKVIKCNLGEPDFALPDHIKAEVKRQIDADNTHYNDPQGILQLRKAVANYLSESRGVEITPDRVVIFPGAKPPIGFCQQTYANHGDEIIYPSPGFPIYESFTSYVGSKAVPLHLDENKGFSFEGSDLEPLISDRTKLIFLNFPSNPTGGVATKEQLEEIAEVIRKKAPQDSRVYSDEVYENILFDGSTHRSIISMPGMAERTILVSGVSKSYSWTGGRVGWAVFPTIEEAMVFKNLNINYFSCVPAYNQEGAREAIESPQSAASIQRMVEAFQERRDVVVKGLGSIDGVTCQNPKGAFYVFPNIGGVCKSIGAIEAFDALPDNVRLLTSPSTLFQMFLLFRYGVASMDRKSFGRIGTEGMHFLRISIATGIEDLKQGIERIAKAAKDVDGFATFINEGKRLH